MVLGDGGHVVTRGMQDAPSEADFRRKKSDAPML